MSATEPAVRVDHVSKRFGSKVVLDDISFEVPKGTAFCLLGKSGTGKSVTLKHIMGLIHPDRGCVMVNGNDIGAMDRTALARARREIGFVFQNAALFDSITVAENVAFPLRRHTDWAEDKIGERVKQVLEQVGLDGDENTMPADLSGGMRKRAGLARAMALDPSILLVDEPSAGLDPLTAAEIDRLLLTLKEHEGTTLVVVTHSMPSARRVGDTLAVIEDGHLIAQGTPEDLSHSDHEMVRAFIGSNGQG